MQQNTINCTHFFSTLHNFWVSQVENFCPHDKLSLTICHHVDKFLHMTEFFFSTGTTRGTHDKYDSDEDKSDDEKSGDDKSGDDKSGDDKSDDDKSDVDKSDDESDDDESDNTSTILLSTMSESECHVPRLCSVTCSNYC